jgi:hypothetical protein
MNGNQLMDALNNKLKHGNLISKQAKATVVTAISTLKEQVADCRIQLDKAKIDCDATKERSDQSMRVTQVENNRLKELARVAGLKADESERALKTEIVSLKEGRISKEELDTITKQLNDMVITNNEEVKALTIVNRQLETANKTLLQEKKEMEAKYVGMLSQAFEAINEALTTIDVEELLKQTGQSGQSGGFQSSSSGVTDFKKYRTSSRSYNIKELRKKKKESRKKEKERKKGSRKKERRSKKRRKD